jgi:hypothetical protein
MTVVVYRLSAISSTDPKLDQERPASSAGCLERVGEAFERLHARGLYAHALCQLEPVERRASKVE